MQKTIEFFLKKTQEDKWDVTAVVKDDDSGLPLEGVGLIIVEPGLTGLTDAQGIYIFRDVPSGVYQVKAARIGYDTQTQTLELPEPPK